MFRKAVQFLFILVLFSTVAALAAFFTISFLIGKEESVVVPDLSGKDALSALHRLSGMELNTRVQKFEYHDTIPENHIVYQRPEAGRMIKKGRDVSLVVSRGTPTVRLPDLRGQDLSRARIVLERNGLEAGNRARVYSDRVRRDTIIAQSPSPGKTVDRSAQVALLVSRGPRPASFEMPDLIGRLLDESVLVLGDYKLLLDSVTTVYDKSKPENMVVDQSPAAGHHVGEDRGVRLSVTRKTAPEKERAGNSDRLFTYRLPHGYLKQHVRLEMTIYGMNVTVYDELMDPGQLIQAIVPEHSRAILFLYLNDERVASEIYN